MSRLKVYGSPMAYASLEDWAAAYRQARTEKVRIVVVAFLALALPFAAASIDCSGEPASSPEVAK